MAGMDKQRLHMAAASPHANGHAGHVVGFQAKTAGPVRNGHHHLHPAPHVQPDISHHHPKIKYRAGLNIMAFSQFIGGLLILNFEAISAVLYRASATNLLHGVEYAGCYVSVFTMITGVVGLLSVRKSFGQKTRMCCFIAEIMMTILLAVHTFTMSCASAAMLVFYTVSWDSILSLVNRVTSTAQINLIVGTTTTTLAPYTLPAVVEAELKQDFDILVGLRTVLFALYFLLFMSAVLSSCLGCCNYCRCWNRPIGAETSAEMVHPHVIATSKETPHAVGRAAVYEKTEVIRKPEGLVETHSEVVPVVVEGEKDKHGHKSRKHHKHKP